MQSNYRDFLLDKPLAFVLVSNEDVQKEYKKKRRIYPERVCLECVIKGKEDYLHTLVWRHVKDKKGKVIYKNEEGQEIWLCNKHGIAQDTQLAKLDAAAKRSLFKKDSKRRDEVKACSEKMDAAKKASSPIDLEEKSFDLIEYFGL